MLVERPRRLRRNPNIRNLVSETRLELSHLIQPYFLKENPMAEEPIAGFTGISRLGVDVLSKRLESDLDRGVRNFLLFGEVAENKKDERGSEAQRTENVIPEALRRLRGRFGDAAFLITDVCLCPVTSHGHCGVLEAGSEGAVLNDASVVELAKVALVHAQAGADMVAPSDMMDGRVGAIRRLLDAEGLTDTGILAYTAKYASAYYGPFREALGSSPKGTDRASYQMDFRNSKDALRELTLDVAEGADIVMVKPALAYLDIIASFRQHSPVPVAAYSVSGEYEMVKRLAAAGMADEKKLALENLTAIARAGASIIITYFASQAAEKGWL